MNVANLGVTTLRCRLIRVFALSLLFYIGGCDQIWSEVALRRGNEIVMCPGSLVSASMGQEQLIIQANGILKRRYQLNQGKEDVNVSLAPRGERWYGSFGLYRPNGVGDLHLVLDEGFQHFSSEDEFLEWIQERKQAYQHIYTSDGLVLGWRYLGEEGNNSGGPKKVLSVELWQLYINGAKPTNLAGSSDAAFSKKLLTAGCTKNLKPFVPSVPASVGGRMYSGRVLDFMRERGISAEEVENLIKASEPKESGDKVDYHAKSSFDNLQFVTLDKTGRVVSIG